MKIKIVFIIKKMGISMRKIIHVTMVFSFFCTLFFNARASELMYIPANPSFGGNAANASWLMNSAQSQNELTEEDGKDVFNRDPLQEFKDNLNRQILSRFSSEIVQAAFGDSKEDLQEGTYQIGDFVVDVKPLNSNIRIIVTDNATGNQTVIEVPYYESAKTE
jgi:curli production assembly/transport component CsgF